MVCRKAMFEVPPAKFGSRWIAEAIGPSTIGDAGLVEMKRVCVSVIV